MITIYLCKADIQTSALSYLLGRSVTCSSKGKTMDTVQLPITLISSSDTFIYKTNTYEEGGTPLCYRD